MLKYAVASAILLLTACVTRTRIAQAPATPSAIAPKPAVIQNIERQVTNAADAGDGDLQTRLLRDRLIADPGNLSVRLALANRYWKAGAAELAIEHYRLAAERFPDDPKVAMLLARALRDFDHPDLAISVLIKFCDHNPKQPADLLSLLGILEDDAGKFVDAEIAYRKALAESPDRADLHNNLGYNLLLQSKAADAVTEFQAALQVDPHSRIANDNLGLALLAQWKDDTQPQEALLHWQSVGDPASAHNNLATILIQQKRYKEAREELEYALSFQHDHEAALRNLQLVATFDGGSAAPEHLARNSFWTRVKTVFAARKQAGNAESAANTH